MSALLTLRLAVCILLITAGNAAFAQSEGAVPELPVAATGQAEPLTDDEIEILVARIALYPDELVAVITAAALYPLQIIEAQRFLEKRAGDPSLEPKDSWDGSVISLLNYPEIVTMMSDDLDWTQTLGDAIAYQQKDVLVAIQQLREEAVAAGIIQSDDKVTVVNEGDNVVIQPASSETIYVPQYPPEMLYDRGYPPAPITYYPDPYPYYYNPTAPFFAGVVTGAIWAAIVDWDDWGVWDGDWDGGDIDIDCNNCFNDIDINGKINFNDVDWKNVDRDKISIDRDQFNKIDRTKIKTSIRSNENNSIRNKAAGIRKERPTALPANAGRIKDVRTSTLEGLRKTPAARDTPRVKTANRPPQFDRPAIAKPPRVDRPAVNGPAKFDRPAGKPKLAARPDIRPKKPSGLGEMKRGKSSKIASKRGGQKAGKLILPKQGGGGRRR